MLAGIKTLELVARRNVSSTLTGDYVTGIRGTGMDFHEARHYLPGDPIRHIDWNMTARHDEPYLRTYLEEREREIFVCVDVSPSMHTGFQTRSKLATAIEIAATIAVSAVDVGDRLGYCTFAENVEHFCPPRGGKRQLFDFLQTLIRHRTDGPARCHHSDPRSAIHAIERLRGKRFVVFFLSDFIDHDVPDDLRYLRRHHDVTLLHVYDPFEYAGDGPVRFLGAAMEGDPSMGLFRAGDTGTVDQMHRFLKEHTVRLGIGLHAHDTRDPVGPSLSRMFQTKKAWIR